MCGIVGFIGQEQAAPILLDGLTHLEYRGYDSAGVAVISAQGKLQVEKAVGRLKVLSEQIHGGADLEGCIGLGHTRWATHGAPNIINSHPHVSENGKFAVIHNGIIENYVEIKEFLIGQGIQFKSETDTEVVAQLLEFYYNECHDFLEAVGRVLRRIEGAYALGMLCADCPDRIIAARKDAPLLLGYGKGCNFLASDVTAIIKHTRDVAYMEDGEVAVLTREGIEVYDALEQKVEKKHFTIDWEVSAAEKGGYQHFMLKEIMEQPEALRRAISPRVKEGKVVFDDLKLPVEKMREFTRIFIVACGSSYHVGMVGKYNLEKLTRMPVEVILASEFRYCSPIVNERTLAVIISQSGETADSLAALRLCKENNIRTLGIVNVVGSSIAHEADNVFYTLAGPEISVATTANPLPASPALAASILAFKAKRLVCEVIPEINSTMECISSMYWSNVSSCPATLSPFSTECSTWDTSTSISFPALSNTCNVCCMLSLIRSAALLTISTFCWIASVCCICVCTA
ncbi:glutamine--fructose-6-phosphate transaminase (isomerizing), partial [bacterium]|nr:glutamine--fructose-6-phosphate transaminase (isomerizing) [bacterium]